MAILSSRQKRSRRAARAARLFIVTGIARRAAVARPHSIRTGTTAVLLGLPQAEARLAAVGANVEHAGVGGSALPVGAVVDRRRIGGVAVETRFLRELAERHGAGDALRRAVVDELRRHDAVRRLALLDP